MRLMLLCFLCLDFTAQARPLEVINPSFENPLLTPGLFTLYTNEDAQTIPGWKTSGGWDGVQNCIGNYDKVPDGMNFAFNDGGSINQTVGALQPGIYTLTVAVGSRLDHSFAGGSLELAVEGKAIQSIKLTEPAKGKFQDETLTCTVAAEDPAIGKPVTISLKVGDADSKAGGGTVDFDHVRLDYSGEPPTKEIHSVTVCEPFLEVGPSHSNGDTWAPAWTKDGEVFSPANDTGGFNNVHSSNINFNRIDGSAPEALVGTTVNSMIAYGGGGATLDDKCTWKSGGCLALDGVLYWTIARHNYGETSGDSFRRQPGVNGSIIKSIDQGVHWTRPALENYDHPMFPGGRFACGYFVNYGQDGHLPLVDGNDKYVYATSNNGFWDNGDSVIVGRVLRSRLPNLDGSDWQFYAGGDGLSASSWDASMDKAAKVIDEKDRCGETGATWLAKQKCYLMIEWFYPAGGGKIPDACTTTTWKFLTAPHPWGPWKAVGTHDFHPQGFYCPEICPKFTSADGTKLFVFTAGNWNNGAVYRLTLVPIALQ